jgi:F0F1-type ATP synthase delta subunit
LKAGIESRIEAVKETIQGLADWLNNIWQTAQDAHSPSKVWWQFGFDLMSGLANGISDSATMPVSSIENLFKDLDVASTAGIITAMGNAVTAISKSIAPAIKALEELQKFNVPRGVLGKFEELLFQINWVVRGFAAFAWKLGDKSLNEAQKFAEVFLGLSDVIYNLGDILAHIKRVEIPTGIADKFDKLVAEAHSLVMIFATATSELEEEAAPQIIAYVDAASAIFDLVEKAIESMQFLTGVDMKAILKDGYHLRDQMIIFRNIVRSTMREFSLAAAEIDAEMSDAVGALATAAESVFGLVEVVIEKAKFLSDADLSVILKDGYHLHDQTIIFRNIVRSTMRLFAEAAKEMRTDGINAVQEYIGAARDVFGIIEEALTAIGLIAEYTGFAELLPKIELFRSDLMDVATELINAIGGMSLDMQEMLRTSGSLAENVTSVLGVIAPALEALASISDYVRLDNLWVLMLEFGESLLQLMYGLNRSMGEINLYIGAEILKTSAEISDSINSVLGVIQPALEALAGLREFVRFDDLWVKLIEFGQELLYLVYGLNRSLGEVNKYIGLEVLKTAAEIATNVTTVIGVVGPALEALGNIGEFVKVENMNAKLTEFMDQLSDAIGGEQGLVARLNEIAGLVGEVEIETASNFATSVAAILGNVMDAFRTLGEMANTDMPGGLKSILTDMVSVLKSAIPDAALAGYDFGTAWINGVREALGAFTLETGLGGTGGGLAVATAGVATAGGLTTNLNVGGLTFNTTISNQMDEEEFHFRVVETIRSLV